MSTPVSLAGWLNVVEQDFIASVEKRLSQSGVFLVHRPYTNGWRANVVASEYTSTVSIGDSNLAVNCTIDLAFNSEVPGRDPRLQVALEDHSQLSMSTTEPHQLHQVGFHPDKGSIKKVTDCLTTYLSNHIYGWPVKSDDGGRSWKSQLDQAPAITLTGNLYLHEDILRKFQEGSNPDSKPDPLHTKLDFRPSVTCTLAPKKGINHDCMKPKKSNASVA